MGSWKWNSEVGPPSSSVSRSSVRSAIGRVPTSSVLRPDFLEPFFQIRAVFCLQRRIGRRSIDLHSTCTCLRRTSGASTRRECGSRRRCRAPAPQCRRDEVDALDVAEHEIAWHHRGIPILTGTLMPVSITFPIAVGCAVRKYAGMSIFGYPSDRGSRRRPRAPRPWWPS